MVHCGQEYEFFNHKLDIESSKLTTFGTPFDRYRYLRMPMGASLSSDLYQYKVDGHLEGIRNCVAIADNIIIFGFDESDSDHDKTVIEVMEKARLVGMRLNPAKCQFKQKQVKFFRLILTHDGVIPDPAKTEALKICQSPKMRNFCKVF